MKKRVAILFDNFGPYHLARLKAASQVCEVLAVEFGSSSAEYDWDASDASGLKRVVINNRGSSQELSPKEFQKRLNDILDDFRPEAVVVPGWGYRGALLALRWGLLHRVPVICMSESTPWDEERSPVKEWVKRRIVSLFSSALVGGEPHRDYMRELGMSPDRIFLGYDAVDNSFFAEKAEKLGAGSWEIRGGGIKDSEVVSQKSEVERKPYFLASARFIEKKNLFRLLKAYALYRQKVERRESSVECLHSGFTSSDTSAFSLQPSAFHSDTEGQNQQLSINNEQPATSWPLILLGDGPLRSELCRLISELGLQEYVRMPGFKQYDELPEYYAGAGAFVHASTTEQWGLVVNEAMASGLPVLVSDRCGCAADLVKEGVNGRTFDPMDVEELARLMVRISTDEEGRLRMGTKSLEIIAEWGPDRFAKGVMYAVNSAVSKPVKGSPFSRLLLKILISR